VDFLPHRIESLLERLRCVEHKSFARQVLREDDYKYSLDRSVQDCLVDGCSHTIDVVADVDVAVLLDEEIMLLGGKGCRG
jgi:hypothetical protein